MDLKTSSPRNDDIVLVSYKCPGCKAKSFVGVTHQSTLDAIELREKLEKMLATAKTPAQRGAVLKKLARLEQLEDTRGIWS